VVLLPEIGWGSAKASTSSQEFAHRADGIWSENQLQRELDLARRPRGLADDSESAARTMFDGRPKFARLNALKNSARNSRVPSSPFARRPNVVSLTRAKSKSWNAGPRNVLRPAFRTALGSDRYHPGH